MFNIDLNFNDLPPLLNGKEASNPNLLAPGCLSFHKTGELEISDGNWIEVLGNFSIQNSKKLFENF